MNTKHLFSLILSGAALCAAIIFCGCEGGGADSNDYFYIDPAEVSIAPNDESAVLHVVGGIGPYAWSVANSNLGTVAASGDVVTYTRTAATGANYVEVLDSNGWLASAVVTQLGQNDLMTIDAQPASLANDDDMSIITVVGGNPPYSWSVTDITLGNLLPGANTAPVRTYVRSHAGDNVVSARDANGTIVRVLISQP